MYMPVIKSRPFKGYLSNNNNKFLQFYDLKHHIEVFSVFHFVLSSVLFEKVTVNSCRLLIFLWWMPCIIVSAWCKLLNVLWLRNHNEKAPHALHVIDSKFRWGLYVVHCVETGETVLNWTIGGLGILNTGACVRGKRHSIAMWMPISLC
jgi:hypothetical protein